MENIKNTNKYFQSIKIVLIAMTFVVITPVVALADYSDYGYIEVDGNYNDYYNDNSYIDVNGDYNYPSNYTNVTSGSYWNNYNDYYGGYSGNSTVSSGSYSGGDSTYTAAGTYPAQAVPDVSSGGYTGGTINQVSPTNYTDPQLNTMTSGGYVEYAQNSYYSQPVYYSQSAPQVSNQVLAYTDTNPTLDSVYLSDVPYTGFSDYYGTIIFVSILLFWSSILAYVFLKRKIESQDSFARAAITVTEEKNTNSSMVSDFVNRNISDSADMNKVEEYARMNKILLSSSAIIKIIKLSRLGKINASEYIRRAATGEWKAIGEIEIK